MEIWKFEQIYVSRDQRVKIVEISEHYRQIEDLTPWGVIL